LFVDGEGPIDNGWQVDNTMSLRFEEFIGFREISVGRAAKKGDG
jgi:hypothetical protein